MPLPPISPDPYVPEVVRVIQEYRAALVLHEEAQMYDMAAQWLRIENKLNDQMILLASEIEQAKTDGKAITEALINRNVRYQELLDQVQKEIKTYNNYANSLISKGQLEMGQLGINSAADAIKVSTNAYFNLMPISAIKNMIGMLGDGTPLNRLLKKAYPDSVDGMTRALIDGMAQGLGPRQTARLMADGMSSGLNRITTIARTEQARAFRTSSTMEYRESGVVRGFMRLVHKETACMACLMSDGEEFELESEFEDHPNGKCACVPLIRGVDDPQWETGKEWFGQLDPERQENIMGAQYFEAWQDDKFALSDLRTTVHNDVWGDSPAVVSLKDLVNES